MVSQEGLYATPAESLQSIDRALLDLLDKARRAADLIAGLRESNTRLLEHIKTLEKTIEDFQQQLHHKDKEIEEFKQRGSVMNTLDTTDGVFLLSAEEREALEKKITDLLQKLHAHLS